MDDTRLQAAHRAEISKRIRRLWRSADSDQADFARGAGISPTAFNNYCKGSRVGLDAAIKLCVRYGLTLDWIYFGLVTSALPPDVREKIANAQPEPPVKPKPRAPRRRPFRRAS